VEVKADAANSGVGISPLQLSLAENGSADGKTLIPVEEPNESVLGKPTVVVNSLRKSYGSQIAVNDLSFKMYENQIFALLGHNGAGKVITNRNYLISFISSEIRYCMTDNDYQHAHWSDQSGHVSWREQRCVCVWTQHPQRDGPGALLDGRLSTA